MIKLTVNQDVAALLGGYVDAVEVRDPKGKVLGHFMPYLTPEARAFYERPGDYFDLEEVERIKAAEHGKGRPLAEFLPEILARETQG
jgi:hypothetical protein